MRDNYTRYPRAILWLVRGGMAQIGGDTDASQPAFELAVASFYLSKLPVTNVQFEAYQPNFERTAESPADDDPATGVSYTDARGYCAWYADVSRKPMRLPTEVEWEYACRGETRGRYFWGDSPGGAAPYVAHLENSGTQMPALAKLRPNPCGLLSMLGGVWEWTTTLYLPYPAAQDDGRDDPSSPGRRVLRGGSFRTAIQEMGCGVRRAADPGEGAADIGFRIARSL